MESQGQSAVGSSFPSKISHFWQSFIDAFIQLGVRLRALARRAVNPTSVRVHLTMFMAVLQANESNDWNIKIHFKRGLQ